MSEPRPIMRFVCAAAAAACPLARGAAPTPSCRGGGGGGGSQQLGRSLHSLTASESLVATAELKSRRGGDENRSSGEENGKMSRADRGSGGWIQNEFLGRLFYSINIYNF